MKREIDEVGNPKIHHKMALVPLCPSSDWLSIEMFAEKILEEKTSYKISVRNQNKEIT